MSRPLKNNADYFSHDTNLRNHRKVKALMNETANMPELTKRDGYAFWCMILEYLTGMDGHEFELSPPEISYFAAEIELSLENTTQLLNFCVQIELLQKDEMNFISSQNLMERLSGLYSKRKRDRMSSKSKQKKTGKIENNPNQLKITVSGNNGAETELPVTDNSIIAHNQPSINHKVKESKLNKSKEREIHEAKINSLTPDFLKTKYIRFLDWTEANAASLFKLDEFITVDEYNELLEKYDTPAKKLYLEKKLKQMHNKKGIELRYTNVYETLKQWIMMDDDVQKNKIINA